nr:hypothetical protein HK105_000205 [Polyrhizophydium stewartii]
MIRSVLRSIVGRAMSTRPAPAARVAGTPDDGSAAHAESMFQSRPGPIPLGDRREQEEFESLLKKAESQVENDVLLGVRHPDAAKQPLPAFAGDRNPTTGEIGGPKGAEPTRYGDWERNGRVYDF